MAGRFDRRRPAWTQLPDRVPQNVARAEHIEAEVEAAKRRHPASEPAAPVEPSAGVRYPKLDEAHYKGRRAASEPGPPYNPYRPGTPLWNEFQAAFQAARNEQNNGGPGEYRRNLPSMAPGAGPSGGPGDTTATGPKPGKDNGNERQ